MENKIRPFTRKEKTRTRSKFATIVLLLIMISVVSITKAEAIFIDVAGSVNPYAGTITDNGTTTTFGQLDYMFGIVGGTAGVGITNLQLVFEDDVFASIGTPPSSPSSLTAGWTFSSESHPDLTHAHLSGSSVQSLTFSMFGVEVYNDALIDPSLWDEGGIWEQAWVAYTTDPSFAMDGGSTVPTPEPASLVLMGTGLLGLGLWSRRRKKA